MQPTVTITPVPQPPPPPRIVTLTMSLEDAKGLERHLEIVADYIGSATRNVWEALHRARVRSA